MIAVLSDADAEAGAGVEVDANAIVDDADAAVCCFTRLMPLNLMIMRNHKYDECDKIAMNNNTMNMMMMKIMTMMMMNMMMNIMMINMMVMMPHMLMMISQLNT